MGDVEYSGFIMNSRSPFVTHPLGHIQDSSLARHIGNVLDISVEAGYTCEIDNLADRVWWVRVTCPGFHCFSGYEHAGSCVYAEDGFHVAYCELGCWASFVDPCAVYYY